MSLFTLRIVSMRYTKACNRTRKGSGDPSPRCRNWHINSAGYEFYLSLSSPSFFLSLSLSLSFPLSSSFRIKLLSVRLREPPRCNDPAHFRAPPPAIRISKRAIFFLPRIPVDRLDQTFMGR